MGEPSARGEAALAGAESLLEGAHLVRHRIGSRSLIRRGGGALCVHGAIELYDAVVEREARLDEIAQTLRQLGILAVLVLVLVAVLMYSQAPAPAGSERSRSSFGSTPVVSRSMTARGRSSWMFFSMVPPIFGWRRGCCGPPPGCISCEYRNLAWAV